MASLKDLRLRIDSVKNTRQITKTMKMVSAAKVRRARSACEAARPYAERLNRTLANLAKNSASGPLLLTGREQVNKVRIMVFGSDRGLCGGFNSNVVKEALAQARHYKDHGCSVEFVAVGRKVNDALKLTNAKDIVEHYVDISRSINFTLASQIASSSVSAFEAGDCDKVIMVYGKFVSMLSQEPTVQQLVPFAAEKKSDEEGLKSSVEYEPSEEKILSVLLPKNVSTQVFSCMLDSAASEQAARMTAMENATNNASEMVKSLNLEYNRTRQAAITTELVEIISGAEAL